MANRQNYAAKIESRKQTKLAAGLLSERFPEVKGMVIHMTYYQKGVNPVLMKRTLNIFPTSNAYFKMDCMIKGCEGGGFDLTTVVDAMVKALRKDSKGSLECCANNDLIASDHASIKYEIVIQYNNPAR